MKFARIIVAVGLLASGHLTMADSVSKQDKLLCAAVEASVCSAEGSCEVGTTIGMKIPQFLIVDLKRKRLSTTEASGENRETDILYLERYSGQIFLQGVQLGRAFSVVIDEATGLASIAIALNGGNIGVFGECTPLPVS